MYKPILEWTINTAGVHVGKIAAFTKSVNNIVASSSRLMCTYGDSKKVAIVNFKSETGFIPNMLNNLNKCVVQ